MEKLKTLLSTLTKISLLCFAFFVLSPPLHAQAVFSDTTNINMGIELELGTVSLGQKNNNPVGSINYPGGDAIDIASSTLVNDGSLTGKLAYKIDIKKENNLAMTDEELKDVTVSIDFGDLANKVDVTAADLKEDSFVFVQNTSGKDVVIEPDPNKELPITIKYKSNAPIKDEKIKVSVTFRLIQSNAKDANAKLFSDEEVITNTLTLVPKVVEPEIYWPDQSKFVKSTDKNIEYSLEKMNMVFSESEENNNILKNLNKAVLYIQIPGEDLTTTIINNAGKKEKINLFTVTNKSTVRDPRWDSLLFSNPINMEDEIEIDRSDRGIKVTFNLNGRYFIATPDIYDLNLNLEIHKYSGTTYRGEHKYKTRYSELNHFIKSFATRLVLSTDVYWYKANYVRNEINLTIDRKNIHFSTVQMGKLENYSVTNETTVKIDTNNKQIFHEIIRNDNITFSLWLNLKEITSGSATLNVRITGDTNNTLVISRSLNWRSSKYLLESKSRSAPIENQESEQQVDVEISEEPTQPIDSTVPDEQIPEAPVEEVAEEEALEESNEIIEPPIEEIVEPDDTITEPIEETEQIIPKEKTSDEQINE